MNWKKIIGIIIAVAAIAVVGYALIFAGKEEETITVRTDKVTEETITETLSLTGMIDPSQTQEVFGQGNVSDLPVAVNDTVEEGDTLISFDGINIDANFSGTVTAVNAAEGEPDLSAQTGTPSVILSDLNELEVAVQLTKTDAPLVEVDQTVTLTSGDKAYSGTVTHVDPVATETPGATGSTQLLNAVISFDENPADLIAGFDIDAEITTNTSENALTIPIEALVYNNENEPFVYTVENDVVQNTPVEIGIQSTTKVEILSGLTAGDTIVLSPNENVKDGITVTTQDKE
ncbi:HlyD family efflux transporter periplasmic adaptor subunit [Desemzia sp. RIT804]|uniref:efflux RND transporter periplasmic adaptor subunit n=1 Tax=Desemzia sp. RIT 804 TaxID=2810209 RepID=UPI0019516ABD|nr:HlyD family efflux transporter periplasmic adaptor subunit [Desemzia sp. RIT 804]MBM6614528.1 HlyD family efflux transporter periplasmic adaptor subunit [Desemzia sp. RIT 804]